MRSPPPPRFIDVFAGCGGLSLGLLEAGWSGVFAVEKNPLAFETLRHNLVDGTHHTFDWPDWLPKQSMTCEDLLEKFKERLQGLAGQIDLIVGGPPCQGFSMAGRRNPADPRNKLTEQYLSVVQEIQPRFLVIENVAGFDIQFEDEEGLDKLLGVGESNTYAEYVASRLTEIGYEVHRGLVNCADFGVPQSRFRYLMICQRRDLGLQARNMLDALKEAKGTFKLARGIPMDQHVSAKEAISDLETTDRRLAPNRDGGVSGFRELAYTEPVKLTAFQTLMRRKAKGTAPNSLRLANHRPDTIDYFHRVRAVCRPGIALSVRERAALGTKKHSTTVLNASTPAPTVTTLPDDILHYDEPRILTVRECARLQSFPDWFAFQGKYTTGGKHRKQECPRYTQVGNAVPPLLAEAIGELLLPFATARTNPEIVAPEGNVPPLPIRKIQQIGAFFSPTVDEVGPLRIEMLDFRLRERVPP
ncbi:hypothetical protein Lal_00011110 [Lupinus albus]|nr:hypothetical protein Lal_00011110 [Lupinus albus]